MRTRRRIDAAGEPVWFGADEGESANGESPEGRSGRSPEEIQQLLRLSLHDDVQHEEEELMRGRRILIFLVSLLLAATIAIGAVLAG
jgi:hypothetical protein